MLQCVGEGSSRSRLWPAGCAASPSLHYEPLWLTDTRASTHALIQYNYRSNKCQLWNFGCIESAESSRIFFWWFYELTSEAIIAAAGPVEGLLPSFLLQSDCHMHYIFKKKKKNPFYFSDQPDSFLWQTVHNRCSVAASKQEHQALLSVDTIQSSNQKRPVRVYLHICVSILCASLVFTLSSCRPHFSFLLLFISVMVYLYALQRLVVGC